MTKGNFFSSMLFITVPCVFAGCASTKVNLEQKEAAELYLGFNDLISAHEVQQKNTKRSCERKKIKKDPSWKELIFQLNQCVAEENWAVVEELANDMIALDARSPWGAYYLSHAAVAQKQYERALWLVELANKKTPDVAIFDFQKARILYELNETEKSIEFAESALRKDPSIEMVHLFLGDLFYRNEDLRMAKKHLEKVLASRGAGLTRANFQLAEVYFRLNDYDRAFEFFEESVKKGIKEPIVYYRLGTMARDHLKKPDQALKYFKEGASLKSGRTGLETGVDFTELIQELEQVIAESQQKQKSPNREPSEEKKGGS